MVLRSSNAVKLTDLHHKTNKGKGILPHQYPASIANDLREASQRYNRAEYPRPPLDAENDVDDKGNGEEDEEDGIGC